MAARDGPAAATEAQLRKEIDALRKELQHVQLTARPALTPRKPALVLLLRA
jgi:hypothetical protein